MVISESGAVVDDVLEPDAQEIVHLGRWGIDAPVARYEKVVYLPLKPICQAMGISAPTQIRRIREHRVMAKHLRRFSLASPSGGGKQSTACIADRILGFWLGTISVNHVRPELRDWLLEFQEELVEAAYTALKSHLQRTSTPAGDVAMRAQLLRLERNQADALAFYFALEQRINDIEEVIFRPGEEEDEK